MAVEYRAAGSVTSLMLREILKEAHALPTDRRTLRRFAFAVGPVLIGIGVFLAWRRDWIFGPLAAVLSASGAALAVTGALRANLLRGIYRAWMTMALLLGWVMTRVLLMLVFYVVVAPIAVVLRLAGKDPLNRRPESTLSTYWIERPPESNDPARMEKYY